MLYEFLLDMATLSAPLTVIRDRINEHLLTLNAHERFEWIAPAQGDCMQVAILNAYIRGDAWGRHPDVFVQIEAPGGGRLGMPLGDLAEMVDAA